MSQNDMSIANQSFPSFRSDLNSALQALASTSSGSTRPSTAYAGQLWLDTNTPSASVWTLYLYDGSDDIAIGLFDSTNNRFVPFDYQASDVASASTIDLDAATGNLVDVTGTTAITAVTLAQGRIKIVRFTGALTFTHGASLVLPTGANITTAAGDFAILAGYASSVVRCVGYFRANGTPVGGTQHYVGQATRDLTTASGNQDVTGFGFTPKGVEISAAVDNTKQASWGFSDGTNNYCVLANANAVAGDFASNSVTIHVSQSGASYTGTVTFLSDGIRIAWTKTNSPTGTVTLNIKASR